MALLLPLPLPPAAVFVEMPPEMPLPPPHPPGQPLVAPGVLARAALLRVGATTAAEAAAAYARAFKGPPTPPAWPTLAPQGHAALYARISASRNPEDAIACFAGGTPLSTGEGGAGAGGSVGGAAAMPPQHQHQQPPPLQGSYYVAWSPSDGPLLYRPHTILSTPGLPHALLPLLGMRAARALRPVCKELKRAVAEHPWTESPSGLMLGGIKLWTACFPRVRARSARLHLYYVVYELCTQRGPRNQCKELYVVCKIWLGDLARALVARGRQGGAGGAAALAEAKEEFDRAARGMVAVFMYVDRYFASNVGVPLLSGVAVQSWAAALAGAHVPASLQGGAAAFSAANGTSFAAAWDDLQLYLEDCRRKD
jgi:hypothetical protein